MKTTRNLQEAMRMIYFDKDKGRGIWATYLHLLEESIELGRAISSGSKSEIASEAADVAAWLASICNLLDIDLEDALRSKYGCGCPKCRSTPCRC
ncbi:nucleotide pyrophosphohydrolase [Candidatus Bathyarchaeota archaeon]|nr:nucleotide pyrophosphohydrolase [Candidatus Bathyarchaeota archaeon]